MVSRHSGATPTVDHTTALTDQNLLYYDAGSGKFKSRAVSSLQLTSSGDTTGATDDANFASAVSQLPFGGEIRLVANQNMPFYTKTGWSPPAQTISGASGGGPVCIRGVGMPVLKPVGAGITAISYHRTSDYGAGSDHWPGGYIRDVVVDGTNATGASVGIDAGDAFGMHIRAWVKNFTGTGAVGFNQVNRVFFTEKCTFEVQSYNCSTATVISHITGAAASHEYNHYDIVVYATGLDGSGNSLNQTGIVNKDSLGGCLLRIRGNMIPTTATSGAPTGNAAMLSCIGSNAIIYRSQIYARVEVNRYSGTGSVNPYAYFSDGSGIVQHVDGQFGVAHSESRIQTNGAEFSFGGDIPISQFPGWPATGAWAAARPGSTVTAPASGSLWKNLGPDAVVAIDSGAGTTGIQLNGRGTGLTSGPFFVSAGSTLKIFWSGSAPTVNFVNARQA